MKKAFTAFCLAGIIGVNSGCIGPRTIEQKTLYPRIVTKETPTFYSLKEYNASYMPEIRSNEYCFKQIFGVDESVSSYLEKNPEKVIGFDNMCEQLRDKPLIILTDVHFIPQQRQQHIRILDELDRKNLVVGLEFLYKNQQAGINDYIQGKLTQKEFVEKYWSEEVFNFYSYFNYVALFDFLSFKKIKTQAIHPSIDRRIFDYIEKRKAQSVKPPYDIAELSDEIREAVNELDKNYWKKDYFVTQLADRYIKEEKQFVMVIGALHATQDHLLKMIFNKTGLKPVIVYQDFAHFSEQRNLYTLNNEGYKRLRKQGLDENNVLKIGNNFFINTVWNPFDLFRYSREIGF